MREDRTGRQALLYIVSGQDDFSISQWLAVLKRGLGDESMLDTNTTTLEGQQTTVDELRSVCESAPFLAEKRLVIVKGLMERFEPKRRSNRQKRASRAQNQQDGYQTLGSYIPTMPESTVLVLVDGEVKGNNPLFKMLAGKAKVKRFPLLKPAELREWIEKRVAEQGGSISKEAVTLLVRLVGSNLWIMASEIDKLLLFAAGRGIEKEDVEMVVSYAQQDNVFAMADAIVEFKAQLAERLVQQLLQRGASPAYLLVMLCRQVRMIVRAKELSKQGESESAIRGKLGLPSDFAARRTLEQANRYSLPRLKQIYYRLLEADLAIKTGKYDGELALTILIAELCQRSRTQASHVRP
jgi:DNA polymerase-3 subunit delta